MLQCDTVSQQSLGAISLRDQLRWERFDKAKEHERPQKDEAMSGDRCGVKRGVVLGAILGSLLFAALAPSLADASKPAHHPKPSGKHKHHHHHKKRRRRVVWSHGRAFGVRLGSLAISVPRGAIRKGQTLTIEKGASKKFPALGTASIAGGPFTISTSQGEPAKPVKVTFHYNPVSLAQGGSPAVLHGWSAFGNWVPEESAVSSSAKTVSTNLDSFSPLDVVEDITWAAGLITGNRTDLPSDCGAAPSWVNGLSFPDSPNDSLPSCIGSGSNASTLYIHVVNNRGYAQFITASGASIDVSHSSLGDSLESTIANGLAKLSAGNTPSSFLLAPGSRATLAIDRPPTSFGETTVTLHSAPQGSTAAAAMGWALLNKLKAEFGTRVDATNCVIGYLHNTLSANPSVSSVVTQLHSCASAATAGLRGSAKTAAEKIASAVLVTDFFYKLIDLETDEAYPPQISFSIPGKNPTNPDIHLGNLDFGTLPAGQQTVEHLTASGGTAPYAFAVWNDPPNLANVPGWVNVAPDGTVTINPPSGTDQSVSFFVYATDANGEHSPFAREEITFSAGGAGGGMSWNAIDLPVPPGGVAGSGSTIGAGWVCSSNGTCVLIGAYHDISGEFHEMIDTLVGGTWSAAEIPVPPGGEAGSGYSYDLPPACSSDGTCVLTGTYRDNGEERGMIDTLAGGSWSAIQVPVPPGGEAGSGYDYALNGHPLGCSSDGTCVLTGTYQDSEGETHKMIDTLVGGTWSAVNFPLPPGGIEDQFYGYSPEPICSLSGTCVLTDFYHDASSGEHAMIDTLIDGTWSAIEAPLPSGAVSPRFAVTLPGDGSCSPAGTCFLFSEYEDAGGETHKMIDTLVGGTWSAGDLPVPPGGVAGSGRPLSVPACSSDSTCALRGEYTDATSGKTHEMLDTFVGGIWNAIRPPVPPDGVAGTGRMAQLEEGCSANGSCVFGGLACYGSGTCVLPGEYQDSGGKSHDMIATLIGGTWSAVELQPPAGFAPWWDFDRLVCPSNGTCVLTGEYPDSHGVDRNMIVTLAGGIWSAIQPPVPSDGINSLSRDFNSYGFWDNTPVCSSNGTCVVIGEYEDTGGFQHPHWMIDTLVDGSWGAIQPPVPPGGVAGSGRNVYTLICPTDSTCMLTGEYQDPGGSYHRMIVIGESQP
jgi:hypothetical protein